MPPLTNIFATDHWSGGDDTDIAGRTPDGGGDLAKAIGEWAQILGQIDIFQDEATAGDGIPSVYPLTDLSLPGTHGTQAVINWPGSGGVIPPSRCFWPGTSVHVGPENPSDDPFNGQPGHETRSVWWEYTGGAAEVTVGSGTFSTRTVVDVDGTCHIYGTFPGDVEQEFTGHFGNPPAGTLLVGCCYVTYLDVAGTQLALGGPGLDASTFVGPASVAGAPTSVSGGAVLNNVDTCAGGGTYDEFIFGSVTVGVRQDATEDWGYRLEVLLSDDGITRDLTWIVWIADTDGGYYILDQGVGTAPAPGVAYTIQLDIDDGDVLTAYLDGSLVLTFDPHTDLDIDGFAVSVLTGTNAMLGTLGEPGMVVCTEFNVLAEGGDTEPPWWPPEVPWPPPCEGDPDNPYPEEPPLPPTTPVDPVVMWIRRNLSWRPVQLPTEDYESEAQIRRNLSVRLPERIAIRKNLLWRYPADPDTDETDPPVDEDPYPPHFDPCEEHPPIPDPPDEDLGPPPDRIFFAFDLPITTIPSPFTAAVNATGFWSIINLEQAEVRGGSIVGGIGGYSKYQSGGQYQRSLMQDWIDSHGPYMDQLIASPNFYGQIIWDDHASFERWNWPAGWDINDVIDELSWAAAYWKTSYPGLRVGIRAREAQFSGGNYPSNIDFMMAQFRYWGLGPLTPTTFVSQELGLASSRGHDILFSVNFENGGLGPSSPYGGVPYSHRVMFEMGPGELETAWNAMIVDVGHMHGIGGWKYSSTYMARAGILDVIARCRNALQAIGAP